MYRFYQRAVIVLCLTALLFSQSTNDEFRATWVITWEHINPDDSPAEGKARIREILDNHRAANMTSVLFQVRQSGTAYYNSSFEPWGYYAGYEDPGYDPLAYAIEEAHKRGLELHAWFNVFQAASMHPGAPAYEHPEWVCRDQDGIPMNAYRALSPGLEAVRAYLVDVAMEIVNNYDIDGLHLDYVRWNEYSNDLQTDVDPVVQISQLDGMITEELLIALNNNRSGRYLYDVEHPFSAGVPAGFSTWEEWWRWSVTTFVQMLHDSIQAVKPHVRLSAAVLGRYNWGGWQAYGTVYQDAALWFNQGYVDQLTPMHYHWLWPSEFYGMLEGDCPSCWSQYIQPGIAAGRLYSVGPGSYMLDDYNLWNNHPGIVNTCRNVDWTDGFQFFSYGTWDFHDYWETAGGSFFARKTKIRGLPSDSSTAPAPPTLTLTQLDSLTYQLTITPSDTTRSYWFVLYRSEDAVVEPDSDAIIERFFRDSTFQYVDAFDGLQDFNGQYTYFTTQLNRWWTESPVSNSVLTDSIPSFAPVVAATTPAEGDTVRVNLPLIVQFTKTMDLSTAAGAFTLEPPVGLTVTWSADQHTATLTPSQNLSYATDYTLTIAPVLTDINGIALDGNGDGIGGDPFQLHFTTEAEDIYGPVIFQSNLDLSGLTDDFDVEDVITIVFDEPVDDATLNSGAIHLTLDGNPVEIATLHTVVNERSALTIRPVNPLIPDRDYLLQLDATITDLLGNPLEAVTIGFATAAIQYAEIVLIDAFSSVNNWWQPTASGSTTGVLAGTAFGTSSQVYLPGTTPAKSARLTYVWDTSVEEHLLREYLSGGPPRNVHFDTTYTLQVYLFGDGSQNLFRFCLDDHVPDAAAAYHEVSVWIPVDWIGWRLVEWDLGSDPVGTWIGNGLLEGTLRIDSFQLTYDPINGAASGVVYFDNLRIVQKTTELGVTEELAHLPDHYELYQNYPNPFNPRTTITFHTPRDGNLRLTVYDLTGRLVNTLAEGRFPAGRHTVIWDGQKQNGEPAASGVYLYRLVTDQTVLTRRMVYLK
jgi:uncharacterized lipoprotein YddW (UPF0748 family)